MNDNDSYEERNRERERGEKETLTPPEEAGRSGEEKNLFLFVGYPADDDVSIGWSPSTTTTQRKKKIDEVFGRGAPLASVPRLGLAESVHQSALSALKGEKKKTFSSFGR